MKTTEELRKLEPAKMLEELTKMQKDHFKVTFDVRNQQSKNTHKIREGKRQIARMKTIIAEKNKLPKQAS